MSAVQSSVVVKPLNLKSQKDFGAVVTDIDIENLKGKS